TPAGTWVPRPAPLALGNFAALRQLPVLGDLFSITRGEECGKRDRSVRDAPGEHRYPLLRGEDVTAYATRHAGLWLDRSELGTRAKSPALYAAPKLLVRRVANNLVAAIERDGCHVLNTLYVLRPRTAVMPSLEYACALLNAPAVNACFRAMWLNDDQLFPYLRIEQLRALPFALPAEATARQAVEVVGQLEASLAAGEQAAAAALQEQLAALVVESYQRAMELARATTL
ncbi:MAG: hypothetical protein HUU35_16035, partial [Armatimonadetes bacterium]|nr:hypothetical protein [Armatimonadota bacterium]